jgi:tetratricopeptide (TPR) repeat protein
VRDPKEVRRCEIRVDGKTVSRKRVYLWDTSKYSNEAHTVTYVVEYADGEVYQSAPRLYRAHKVRSRLLSGGVKPWQEMEREGRELFKEGKYREGFELVARAVMSAKKNAGPDHADTGVALCSLGTICESMNHHAEAEKCYKRALAILEKALGSDHKQVRGLLRIMTRLYESMGEPEKAGACRERVRKAASGR